MARYAGLVPEKCREQFFPGVAAVDPTSSSSVGGTPTATTTGSMTGETGSPSTSAESAASTATTSSGSDSGSGGAGVRNMLAWPVAAAAIGGVLAAFAL